MAKIKTVTLSSIPDFIKVGEGETNVVVETDIEFHPIDKKLEMEYILFLFLYDVHGVNDIPVLISNWDESQIRRVSGDGRNDDFLCKTKVLIRKDEVQEGRKIVKSTMQLDLGKLKQNTSVYSRKFEVFATMIPAVDRVSKYSEAFESQVVF